MMPNANNDKYQKHPLPDDFPISTLGSYRENLVVPTGSFDCDGSWTQVFGIHSTGTGSSRVGTLTLTRRVGADGSASLKVHHEKRLAGSTNARIAPKRRAGAAGARRVLQAVMQIDADVLPGKGGPLSTPRQWSFRTQVFQGNGRVIPEAGLRRRATVKDGKLLVATGTDTPRSYPLSGRYTVGWALLDAVARLPREPFDPIDFTLIDHFDQIKPRQKLVFRRRLDTSIAGRSVRLFGFDHTGRGIMPWTYWVDTEGRVVVAISGLETYMLESASASVGQPEGEG